MTTATEVREAWPSGLAAFPDDVIVEPEFQMGVLSAFIARYGEDCHRLAFRIVSESIDGMRDALRGRAE